MPVGRIFGDLSVFDLLGNFIPGIVLTGAITLLLPRSQLNQLAEAPVIAVLLLGVIAFAFGHLIQSYAAQAVGQRETFRNSIFLHQSLGTSPILDFETYPTVHPRLYSVYSRLYPDEPDDWSLEDTVSSRSSETENDSSIEEQIPSTDPILEKVTRIPARFYRSLIEAIAMVRIKRDRPLSELTIAGKAWNVCRKTLFCRRLLILVSCRCEIEESKDTASAVSVRHDSARCVWLGIGRSGPVGAGSLA